MPDQHESELRAATDAIVASLSRKRIVVAGPGTGKTTLFRLLLDHQTANGDCQLVLTFINNLKDEFERSVGTLARVFTFHGYCRSLLHRLPALRVGLSDRFRYFPPLKTLIESDWQLLRCGAAPDFAGQMRRLELDEVTDFYLGRAEFYDAVAFDDSVLRAYRGLLANQDQIESYNLVVVDEYQDFNRLEASLIDLLATSNSIIIAGDDDQALYAQLRDSSTEFIRDRWQGGVPISNSRFACAARRLLSAPWATLSEGLSPRVTFAVGSIRTFATTHRTRLRTAASIRQSS